MDVHNLFIHAFVVRAYAISTDKDARIGLRVYVSTPLTGLCHFYLKQTLTLNEAETTRVSTPLTGLCHFYKCMHVCITSSTSSVSPPLTGLCHFYQNLNNGITHMRCVNALNGLMPFLQKQLHLILFVTKSVNALNGLMPFLRYPLGSRINTGFTDSFLQVFV